MVKEIMTNNGDKILVDDEDYEFLSGFSLRVTKRNGRAVSITATAQVGRLLMDPKRNFVVDHINGNPLDNRRENLNVTTLSANTQNRAKVKRNGRVPSSRYKGVSLSGTRCGLEWTCTWTEKGKLRNKLFRREVETALYYDMKVLEIHGSRARTNFLRTRDRPTIE